MAYYYYSIDTYFQGDIGKIDYAKLYKEIVDAGLNCTDSRLENGYLRIGTSAELTIQQQVLLTSLVVDHRPNTTNSVSLQINKSQLTATDYRLIGKIKLPSSSSYVVFKANAYTSPGTTYSLRIFNHQHNSTLAEASFTNTDDHDIVLIGDANDVGEVMLELQGKVAAGKAYVDSFILEWA